MRVMVTGASGFVGGHLVQHLLASGDEVLGVDRHSSDWEGASNAVYKTATLDISDVDTCTQLIGDFKPEVIFHLAGIAFVPEAENNFDRALLVNVGGTNNIVRACHLLQLGTTVVYASSAEVYGRIETSDLPVSESTPLRPGNNYSLSKVMGELVLERYARFGYVRPIILRPFNHVGPGQNTRFVVASFAEQLAHIAAGRSAPVLRVGNLEGKRDFTDVRDIVRAYRLAALRGGGVYNLASGQPVKIREILDRLIAVAGINVEIEYDQARMRPSEVPVFYGEPRKAREDLGWELKYDLDTTLRDVYTYFEDQKL